MWIQILQLNDMGIQIIFKEELDYYWNHISWLNFNEEIIKIMFAEIKKKHTIKIKILIMDCRLKYNSDNITYFIIRYGSMAENLC